MASACLANTTRLSGIDFLTLKVYMGETVFANMVSDMTAEYHLPTEDNSVSIEDYEQWKREYTWDALVNIRYGQSFCNHFNIQDNRLYYERDWVRCDTIIRVVWLARP